MEYWYVYGVWLSIWHTIKAQLVVPIIIICYGSKEKVWSGEFTFELPLQGQ